MMFADPSKAVHLMLLSSSLLPLLRQNVLGPNSMQGVRRICYYVFALCSGQVSCYAGIDMLY